MVKKKRIRRVTVSENIEFYYYGYNVSIGVSFMPYIYMYSNLVSRLYYTIYGRQ